MDRWKLGVAALIVAALALVLTVPSHAPAKGRLCPHQNAKPSNASVSQLANSFRCLVNKERTKRGLDAVHNNSRLRAVESAHVSKMLRKHCFRHRCGNEKSLSTRVRESGYVNSTDSYKFVENLGYESTPKKMIERLLSDRSHRRNILLKNGRDIGVATGRGRPIKSRDRGKFVTYAMLIANRKSR